MLYIYHGNDLNRTGVAITSAIEKLRVRVPHAAIERITSEVEALELEALLASQGLFHSARVVVLDGVFVNTGHKTDVLGHLAEIAASEHVFFIREVKLSSPEIKKMEKYAQKVIEYSVKETKKEPLNSFALADALLARNKKGLWLKLIQTLRSGSSPEELHGILFWGAKNLSIASGAESPKEAGMHPFVYKKTCTALFKFKPEEVQNLVADLAELPHKARRAGVELEYALEQFALTR